MKFYYLTVCKVCCSNEGFELRKSEIERVNDILSGKVESTDPKQNLKVYLKNLNEVQKRTEYVKCENTKNHNKLIRLCYDKEFLAIKKSCPFIRPEMLQKIKQKYRYYKQLVKSEKKKQGYKGINELEMLIRRQIISKRELLRGKY